MKSSAIALASLLVFGAPAAYASSEAGTEQIQDDASTFDARALWTEIRADIELFYAYLTDRGFDEQAYLNRLGSRLIKQCDIESFRRELHRGTFAFTDPHFIVGPFEDTDFNIFPTASDLVVGRCENRYCVVDVRADSGAQRAGVVAGWELVRVNGASMDEGIANLFEDLIPEPNTRQRNYAATLLVNGRRAGYRTLELVDREGELRKVVLPNARDFAKSVNETAGLELDYPSPMIARLRVNNSLGDIETLAKIDSIFRDLPELRGFILDLRNTPSGGNTTVAQSIMGHFVESARPYQIHDYPSMEREFGVARRSVEYVLPRQPLVTAPLVVIGGQWTGSMGEGMVIGLDSAASAQTIASDMGDLLGGLSNFKYQGGAIKLDMGTYKLSHMDGTPREDYVADISLEAAERDDLGYDPAMVEALRYFGIK